MAQSRLETFLSGFTDATSLLVSDGTETWVRQIGDCDIVLLVCQQENLIREIN